MDTWLNTGVALVSFTTGILIGYAGRGIIEKQIKKEEIDYRNFVLIIVSLAWFTSVVYEIINPEFQTNPLVHGLMGGVVGFFFKLSKK
jgi:hypothetical protein